MARQILISSPCPEALPKGWIRDQKNYEKNLQLRTLDFKLMYEIGSIVQRKNLRDAVITTPKIYKSYMLAASNLILYVIVTYQKQKGKIFNKLLQMTLTTQYEAY